MTASVRLDEMAVWSRYIHQICGIQLDDSKRYLLETRLGNLLTESGARDFTDFFNKVKADASNKLRSRIIEAITTNETSFFRDTSPFELLRHKLIPELLDRRRRTGARTALRIWSAACSTGQEAYSTGIVLRELLVDLNAYDIQILGTDISNRAVAQASYGEYTRLELERGLGQPALARHFTAGGERWRVRDEVRALATFRTMNLLEPFSFPKLFDIIFCRNVAIYFSEQDKRRLFQNLVRCLARDGALIIGSTETITGICPELEPRRHLRAVYYQPRAAAGFGAAA